MIENIVIYGAGKQGQAAKNILSSFDLEAYAFADADIMKVERGSHYDSKVISLDALRMMDTEKTAVIIGIGAYRINDLREVDRKLTEWGFDVVFWSAIEFVEEYFPERLKRTLAPPGIVLTLGIGCPVCCAICPQDIVTRKYIELLNKKNPDASHDKHDFLMSFETGKLILDKLPPNTDVTIVGFYEPSFNPNCTDMIIYAFKQGRRVALYSTLNGFTKKDLMKLRKANVVFEYVVPHLPNINGTSNIPVTNEYLELVEDFLRDFASKTTNPSMVKERLYSSHGVVRPEFHEMLSKYGYTVKDHPENVRGIGGYADTSAYDQKYVMKGSQIKRARKIICDRRFSPHVEINRDDLFYCEFYATRVNVLPNGDVTKCDQEWGLECILGNLLEQSFESLFSTEDGAPWGEVLKARANPDSGLLCWRCECSRDVDDFEIVSRKTHLLPGKALEK